MVKTVNVLKSMVLTFAALTSTAVMAEGGSERASQAAEKMRMAQQMRFEDQRSNEAARLVNADKKPTTDLPRKSEG